MSTLLLRLAAPMQAWGIDGKFDRRGTERLPTKSGVIGLVAAALGRRRDDRIDDLVALRFGVRADREGKLLRDYHTAASVKSSYVTNRYYLCDAVFLAGLEGEDALLKEIDAALRAPAFPLYLGRRSCPPEGIVTLGIRPNASLRDVLCSEAPLCAGGGRRIMLDADGNAGFLRRDLALSFSQSHRQFGFRRAIEINAGPAYHDPMNELEESKCTSPE